MSFTRYPEITSYLSEVHNYYEAMVIDAVQHEIEGLKNVVSEDTMCDLVCLSLNQLPARYIRNDVDMAFYQSQPEYSKMIDQVNTAVHHSLKQIGIAP